jgi:hypothetical protein
MRVSSPVSKHLAYMVSQFLERDYPGKVIMWWFFHLLSTSQYNSRSNHSGHACCYTNLNHLEHHLLCAGLYYVYKIQESSVTHVYTIKDLGTQLNSKLHFHAHVEHIFSQSLRTLGLIRTLIPFLPLTAYCHCIQH